MSQAYPTPPVPSISAQEAVVGRCEAITGLPAHRQFAKNNSAGANFTGPEEVS